MRIGVILQKTSPRKAQLFPKFLPAVSDQGNAVRPQAGLVLLLLAQLLLLIVFPLLGHHAPPLDVVEMHTWAFEPQLGYYKHPPLPAWGVYLSEAIFGRRQLALFVPSAVSVAIATLAVWPLARRMFGARRALVALFLQSTLAYYNLYAPDFNHNVAQMPFWALAVCALYFALRDGRARWWFGFGLALGMSALAKYSAVFLLPGVLLMLAWDSGARRQLGVAKLLAAGAGVLVCFGPHFWWLVAHQFAPLHYIAERVGELGAHASWLERFGSYLGAQLLAHVVLLAVWLGMRRSGAPAPGACSARFDDRFLVALGLGPFCATVLVGLSGSYLHPMWASAMFPLSGLLLVRALGMRAERLYARQWALAWLALMLVIGAGYASKNTGLWSRRTNVYARAAYPGPELARLLEARWRAEVPDRPLRTIVGTPWEAGVASFFSQSSTAVLIDADFAISPWVTPDEIARCGAIVAWNPLIGEFLPALMARFPNARILAPLEVDPQRAGTYYRKVVAAAVIAPQTGSPAAACHSR